MSKLSFDGKGINGPDEYRTRIATFTSDQAAREYGPLFEASSELLEALKGLVKKFYGVCEAPSEYAAMETAIHAIYKAEGK